MVYVLFFAAALLGLVAVGLSMADYSKAAIIVACLAAMVVLADVVLYFL